MSGLLLMSDDDTAAGTQLDERPGLPEDWEQVSTRGLANMDPDRLEQIRRILSKGLDKPAAEREDYVAEACGTDDDLRRTVQDLLAKSESDGAGLPSNFTQLVTEQMARSGAADTSLPPILPQPGESLGRYRLVEKIGQGGMGVVYRGLDTALDREVAIKLLPSEWATDPEKMERFKREAKVVASLSHPNIVMIHSIEESGSVPFMVMELIDGCPLRKFIPDSGLPLRQVLEYLIPVADALAAAHAGGVTHRDLKPENIMVLPDGRVKVLDFGLARREPQRQLSTDAEEPTETASGEMLIGTPAYMSPEQLRSELAGPTSDVFSFGTLLYEIAVGKRPFRGRKAIDVAASILREEPEPASNRADLPAEFEAIVATCLAKEAADRPPTLAPVLAKLQALRRRLERSALEVLAERSRDNPAVNLAMPQSIAVAPFQDLSPSGDQGFLCEGIAEEIAAELPRVADLRVTLVSRMDREAIDPLEMGRLLGVTAILDGSVRQSDERLKITVRLTAVVDGKQMWSERFETQSTDALAVQEEVAKQVARKFDADPSPSRHPLRSRNAEAYAAYLRGRYFWGRRYENGLRRALEFFEEALSLDPAMAKAHAGRADCFVLLAHFGLMEPVLAFNTARESAKRALDISPDLAEAHTTMGWIAAFFDWSRHEAERWFQRAIELDPNYATAWEWNGIHLLASGRSDEALESMHMAQSLDPLSLMISTILGWAHFETHNEEEAHRILSNVLEMEPRFVFAHNVLGLVLATTGQADEAIEVLERGAALSNRESLTLAFLGLAYGLAGRIADADRVIAELEEARAHRHVPHMHFALVHLGAGRYDDTLDQLGKAVAQRESFFASSRSSRAFDVLRGEPRFADLTSQLSS
jgi:serine/threonine protein kinase/tetratricopeptide (TPR) repeat protein